MPKKERKPLPCIPRAGRVPCSKDSGVCSIRMYRQSNSDGTVTVAPGEMGRLVTTCPCRFEQEDVAIKWVGKEILQTATPLVVGEVAFLERTTGSTAPSSAEAGREGVGKIDRILVHPTADPMDWCAVEIQAVYFSGMAMVHEFTAMARSHDNTLPFPLEQRRPDWRSSGPKRLMPQMQIKVPTLRRWGKKMGVVVDESFFAALGTMTPESHMSSADIAWFVLRYDESNGEARLAPGTVVWTTLEHAVEGLTAGRPVSLAVFEERIRTKLSRLG
jgi:hypothetical protein